MSSGFRNVLLYSTWLVLGAMEILLGVERFVTSWADASPLGYCAGTILIGVGALLLTAAHKVGTLRSVALISKVRALTLILVILVFGTPLLHVLVYCLPVLLGMQQANSAYYHSIIKLGLIILGYPVALAWARRRLLHPALSPHHDTRS